ncbi:SBBP repeat-containing protein [Rufibacter sp. H-1]|uniref:SBBP repeat-containing protein n=1 Tax=Rufibacter sediminis TaxID=2762756 RepID=A0ABR6VV55_9BACT|nr:SBBP repeat-containing protein [Rufibacter sediminis]MBC3541085.1 SBBP repeat-containing protein [Rufibacter sediminis]
MLLLLFLFSIQFMVQGQEFAWARYDGGGGTSITNSVAVDKAGNVYVTGSFRDEIKLGTFQLFGTPRLDPRDPSDINLFVAKYDPAGNVVWALGSKRIPNSSSGSSVRGFGITVDQHGSCYVTGYTFNEVEFGGHIMGWDINSDLFALKLNPEGKVQWITEKVESLNYGKDVNIQVDAAGNSYIVGVPLWMVGTYVMKLDPNGKLLWKKGFTNAVADRLSLDEKQGAFYMAGKLVESANIDGTSLASVGSSDLFIGKLDMDGNTKWVKRLGGTSADSATGIASDGLGNVYLSGIFQGSLVNSGVSLQSKGSTDGIIIKLKQDGEVDWAKTIGGTSADTASSIAISSSGRLLVTGSTTGQITFNKKTYSASSPTGTLFVAEFGASGTEKSFFTLAGEGRQQSRTISAGFNNDIAFGGAFSGKVQFSTQKAEVAKEKMFVAKLTIPETPDEPETPEEPELPTTPPGAIAVEIPNIFTPNGDQKNEAFEVLVTGGPESKIELSVYNRFGNRVYYQKDYKNTWTGQGLADSTYFYLVQVKAGDQVVSYKGWVEIMR